MLLTPPHFNYLVIALLSILFIGTIAFSNNITAFTLHSLPTFLACLIMAEGEQWLRMTYCFMLPIAGITLQNIIQKRSDAFTQGLMDKLMHERNTLNDLSMLDPLTGLYNRRGLQTASIPCWRWTATTTTCCSSISITSRPITITMVI